MRFQRTPFQNKGVNFDSQFSFLYPPLNKTCIAFVKIDFGASFTSVGGVEARISMAPKWTLSDLLRCSTHGYYIVLISECVNMLGTIQGQEQNKGRYN